MAYWHKHKISFPRLYSTEGRLILFQYLNQEPTPSSPSFILNHKIFALHFHRQPRYHQPFCNAVSKKICFSQKEINSPCEVLRGEQTNTLTSSRSSRAASSLHGSTLIELEHFQLSEKSAVKVWGKPFLHSAGKESKCLILPSKKKICHCIWILPQLPSGYNNN